MAETEDWRLQNDVAYLRKAYMNPTDGEEICKHAPFLKRCEFCLEPVRDDSKQWWFVPEDISCCVCEECYHDFEEQFEWHKLDGYDMEWIAEPEPKWGVCLDVTKYDCGLYQKVVQYVTDRSNKRICITTPKTACLSSEEDIKELKTPPKFFWGESVVPINLPDEAGVIVEINWHFKSKCYFYKLRIGGKIKSKRFLEEDLKKYSK